MTVAFRQLIICGTFWIVISGCAIGPTGGNIRHDESVPVVLNTTMDYQATIREIARAIQKINTLEYDSVNTGEIRSIWTVIDTCWAGLARGGSLPCARMRTVVHVMDTQPVTVTVRVERQVTQEHENTYMMMTFLGPLLGGMVTQPEWIDMGIDREATRNWQERIKQIINTQGKTYP